MTNRQLNVFYSFLGLDFSEKSDDLIRLKKTLLLEIKSTANGFIHIKGKDYSKQDILTFFDAPKEEHSLDVEDLIARFPDIKKLENPLEINEVPGLFYLDQFAEYVEFFAETESPSLLPGMLQALKRRMSENDFEKCYYLMCYVRLFTPTTQYEIKKLAKDLLKSKLLIVSQGEIKYKDTLFKIFIHKSYGLLVNIIANDDTEFILFQIAIFDKIHKERNWIHNYEACEQQLMIDLPEDYKNWVISMKSVALAKIGAGEISVTPRDKMYDFLFAIGVLAVIVISILTFLHFAMPKPVKLSPKERRIQELLETCKMYEGTNFEMDTLYDKDIDDYLLIYKSSGDTLSGYKHSRKVKLYQIPRRNN